QGPGLRYEGSAFHRIIPGFVVQGGDFTKGDGTGGQSIYGGKFEDEPFMRHHKHGLLSMANSGKNTNGSQFFITLKAVAHLDGKHVVFGEVQSGMKVLDRMKSVTLVAPKQNGKPSPDERVVIAKCGQLHEDGSEMQRPTAVREGGAQVAAGSGLFGSSFGLSAVPQQTSTFHSFSRPSPLGGSLFGAATGGEASTTTARAGAGADAGKSILFSNPAGRTNGTTTGLFGGGFGASQGCDGSSGGDGLFGVGSTPPSDGLALRSPSTRKSAPITPRPTQVQPGAAATAPATSGSDGGTPRRPCGGFRNPGSPEISLVASSFASLAAAQQLRQDRKDDGYDCESDDDAAAGRAFDRFDAAGTGWIGEKDFEALVENTGMPFTAEEQGTALLDLCSPRLPRARFIEWCATAKREQQRSVSASLPAPARAAAAAVEGAAAGLGRAGAAAGGASRDADGDVDAGAIPSPGAPLSGTGDSSVAAAKVPSEEDGSDDEVAGSSSDDVYDGEKREEKAKAGRAFDKIDACGEGWIEESQFEALMEAVGTTYSVEDHKPKLLSICEGGRLSRDAFLRWYDDWLFGRDESSDEKSGPAGGPPAGKSTADVKGFASLLGDQAKRWKCEACLVSNPESSIKCGACETARPGMEDKVVGGAGASGGSSGMVVGMGGGSGGFTFGSAPAATSASETAASAPTVEDHTAALATAGVTADAVGGFPFGSPPESAPTGPASSDVVTNAARGFALGTPLTTTSSPLSVITAVDASELADAANVSNDGEDDDDDEEKERQEERAKAEVAFDTVDSDGNGCLLEDQFEALMEAVGTTYSVEDHKPKLLSICEGGRLSRDAFLRWYDDWLFGEDESSDEESGPAGGPPAGKSTADVEGFASLLEGQAKRWKCEACLVSNPESSIKCGACETARPGMEDKVVGGAGVGGGRSGMVVGMGGGSGGFTFGSAPAATSASEIMEAGITANNDNAAAEAAGLARNAVGGFTFGSPPVLSSTAEVASSTAASAVVPAAGVASSAAGGLTFGTTIAATSSPPSVVTAADTSASGDAVDVSSDGEDDDDDEEKERQEERAKAEVAFDTVDSDGNGCLLEDQFEALMEAVGTTYSVEDHKPKLLSIC
ncbi:unnamed protein product, partial [Sphacelaria rigidula]